MKKIIYLIAPLILFFVSCRKENLGPPPIDESQWLNQERAVVVESDYNCSYYVVEGHGGYSVLRSFDGAAPLRGSILYGDFSNWGARNIYNRTEGYITRAEVTHYWLSYWDAIDEMDYQCNY